MMTGCHSTLSRKVRGKGKSKSRYQKGNRPTSTTNTSSTDINTCKNCDRRGLWAKDCWRPVEEHTTIPPVTATCRKAKARGKASTKTLWNRISLLTQLQPQLQPQLPQCRILRKHRAPLDNSRAFQTWNRGSWHGCDNQFRVKRKTSWCREFAS